MEGANADSDHSMTWEDFFGSTTDLTPTLIGIYDSLLEPSKSLRPDVLLETAKDARNDPPVKESMTEETKDDAVTKEISSSPPKDPSKIAGSIKLPLAMVNKSSLYGLRTKSDTIGASVNDGRYDLASSDTIIRDSKLQRTFKETKSAESTFDNLSPNVKRMISSATETTTLKFQKKNISVGRSSTRHKSNIPLVGATSKISQSGVEILPSVEIYDQPCLKNLGKHKIEEASPSKTIPIKPSFKIDAQTTYDVPTNNRPAIYDIPNAANKTAFESLSLPYIDQSIELSITSNDREFDIKISSKDNSPQKLDVQISSPDVSPAKLAKTVNGTNSLHRKDFKSSVSPKQLLKTGPYPETIGSTGNLKTLTIPEKEVIRLNPPTVDVSRPLSMSSIASSSSTSSSGNQNKGGVNSAYLASIESLDDHSDADMTSANGSNNFVNNAGISHVGVSQERHAADIKRDQAPDEMSVLTQLERVCGEIVQTENVYVEDLRQVVEGYLLIWRTQSTFSEEELSELFNNIEAIYAFNRSLCDELNSCRLDATCIARCFVNNTSGFSVYTSYCTGYPRTMERLAALASRPESAREFRDRQLALGHPLPLASYLLKPVQRILKYHLLLQNMVKQCASSETEYALLKMTGIAQHIDDMKRRHEHAVRVQEIQSLLYGWNGPDLTTYGELCAEGTFRVLGAKGMRHVFLFDKMLLVTKNREDGILAYKSHIMCNNMMLVEAIAGAPLAFHAIPWDAPRSQLTLQARSPRHKREWTLLLKRVILENYNAVIPSHARQLVMELGQNKTDDDMLAEKSHNLITQASMRKQLSAPEYLEKRKIDRERRKSFENGIRGRMKKVNRKYTVPNTSFESSQECDCAQVSAERGIDYTCDHCYIDLCSDCETEASKSKAKESKCNCKQEDCTVGDKCPECDRSLPYIDCGSVEHLERKQSDCKCSDFKSSQESFSKDYPGTLNKIRGYHSSDNIVGYSEGTNSREYLRDTNVRDIPKTCLKCSKIKENIPVTDSQGTLHRRKSRYVTNEKHKTDTLRSKSKDDPQRSKLSKIGTWRRKSEPGLQQNPINLKKVQDSDNDRSDIRGFEKIEFECRNCGSNKISRKIKTNERALVSDPEVERKRNINGACKQNVEIRMYNTKNVPKKISKLKKNRAKGFRLGSDTTAKFYADFSTDVSTENILHISESNDSLNIDKSQNVIQSLPIPDTISKDEDIDEETYKKLIEKTDSFKKNELEKVKYLNKQKVITEGSELEERDKDYEKNENGPENVQESCEETEQPLEQIISQLLMQNRDFQKLIKKQQRNSAQRRHQRLLKSYSNPEHVIVAREMESSKLKPKYGRQISEDINLCKTDEKEIVPLKPETEEVPIDDDHIYETLRVDKNGTEDLDSLNISSKEIHCHDQFSKEKQLPSPPIAGLNAVEIIMSNPESDYVYLSFDKLNNSQDVDGIYDVPVKSPGKVSQVKSDYYVTMEHKKLTKTNDENLYDSLVEVCRRKKEESSVMSTDYLPMSPDQQCPNTPEIWLSRQKEHFNVCRDRKSGSLPRSFQVVVNSEENDLNSFKCKPNSNSKTYLNRDGKVINTDRPFTIASDKSEISYDDVENYMSEGDILKFNKNSKCCDGVYQNVSQSTLELEEEIDRCYKNNFQGINLDKNKNENLLTVSQTNLNASATSSCEVLPIDSSNDKPSEVDVIHPENKIYKPTSNLLSLRNVLSRFKTKTSNKNSDDSEINANDQSSPDSMKSEIKSPTNEKRSALNPRSYSKNLLQRFKSIIGDEHFDGNQNKTDITRQSSTENYQNNTSEIQVVVTTTDVSSCSSATNSLQTDAMSKSISEHSTLTESQIEKNNLESLSHSCDNISPKHDKPSFDKSISMVIDTSSTFNHVPSPSRSQYQHFNKLPIYMQGSKHLGARIAQSDYVDPQLLASEKSPLKNVNVLINKNAIRPDSLFSNSSFATSSSEGTHQEIQNRAINSHAVTQKSDIVVDLNTQTNTDESFYEKSFEKIENMLEDDVFRDSAVYSDQDDSEDIKNEAASKITKTVTRIQSIKKEDSIRCQNTPFVSNVGVKTTCNSRIAVSVKKTQEVDKSKTQKEESSNNFKPKIAPPVPVKPKVANITSAQTTFKSSGIQRINTVHTSPSQNCTESMYTKTQTKRCTISKPIVTKSVSISNDKPANEVEADNTLKGTKSFTLKLEGSIHIKRLSFERASLDSATRKIKTIDFKKINEQPTMTSKSVLERRMEIEMLSKSQTTNPSPIKSVQKPKPVTKKVATFQRTLSDNVSNDVNIPLVTAKHEDKNNSLVSKSTNEQSNESNELDPKSSWVKQVVNKFQ